MGDAAKAGRRQTTGHFEAREELIKRVLKMYYDGLSAAAVARNCEVSETVVSKILEEHVKPETEPTDPAAVESAVTPAMDEMADDTIVRSAPAAQNPEFTKYEIAKRIARVLAASSMVPENYRDRPADCFVAIQMGSELGMGPFQSIQSIAVIDGKPCLYGDGLIGVVRASPLCTYIREGYDEATATAWCETLRRGDKDPIRATFSKAEADLAGLTTKNTWRKYPKRMLQMRARAYCLRDAYPDVLKGLRVVEEVLDYSDEPAPVRSFDMPTRSDPVPDIGNEPVSLQVVISAISTSTTLAELIKAGDLAKRLTSEDDIRAARVAYAAKREALAASGGK